VKLQAAERLLADKATREKRKTIQDKIDTSHEKIDQLKKGLPSRYNRMKVSKESQINKRKQILNEKLKVQDMQKQKLRLKDK
jgi:hypothetical protein